MKEIIERLETVIEATLDSAQHFDFSKKSHQHCFAASLNGSIVEISYSCLVLLKKVQVIGLPILLRSMLEGLVDLVNICKDENYSKNMQAAYFNDQRRFFKNAIDSGKGNPFLAALANDEKLPEAYESVCRDLAELKEQGYSNLQIYERFELAELQDLYTSVYCLLCRESHNNLSSLEKRHLTQCENDFKLEYFKEWEKSDLTMFVDSIAGITVGAVKECHKLFNSEGHESITACDEALKSLREII